MADIKISIINETTVLNNNHYLYQIVQGIQTQIHRDFAPIWGVDADLISVPKGATADPKTWWLVLLDDSDQAGALGYHELNPQGLPLGKVFIKTDLQYGLKWSVTMSHEILEMLCDPDINLTSFIQDTATSGYLYAFEMCDAVEDDQFSYNVGGVAVSDFVLPSYFQPSIPATKWDFCGHLTGCVPTMLSGGYLSKFPVGETGQTGGWTQITAQKLIEGVETPSRATRSLPTSRRSKRASNRTEWKNSKNS